MRKKEIEREHDECKCERRTRVLEREREVLVVPFGPVSCLLQSKSQQNGGEGRHIHTSDQLNVPEMAFLTAWCGSPRLLTT